MKLQKAIILFFRVFMFAIVEETCIWKNIYIWLFS